MKRIVMCMCLLAQFALVPAAGADQRAEVEQAFASWRSALSSSSPEKVVSLYQSDAVLLPTLSPKVLTTQPERLAYFEKLLAKPKLAAAVNEEHVKLLDNDNAVVSGLYTFSYEQDGKSVKLPARYSFVFEKKNGSWLIAEHHSSLLPDMH